MGTTAGYLESQTLPLLSKHTGSRMGSRSITPGNLCRRYAVECRDVYSTCR
jgi:hypothetical protein